MPSKRRLKSALPSQRVSHPGAHSQRHIAFFPLLTLCFIVWMIYRLRLGFPVWFDETVGKAVFFGLPVWLYVAISQTKAIIDTFSVAKVKRGLLLGLAVGGLYGFMAAVVVLAQSGAPVQAAPLFALDEFWWQFFLALMTGFWETLFFYCWVMVVIQEKFVNWALAKQVGLVALIFTLFHIPNAVIRYQGIEILAQITVLFLFALGQGFVFARRHNAYTLILSHAIWGMVLLVHLSSFR
ncbi:MAG TPA: CPBP family glutamic-type intramembrane protease [Vitreimonas sp.]|nr:CPBP family glutamic-type intramembrane protease [Vitreimonas sp.]